MTEHGFLCNWPALDCACGYTAEHGMCAACGDDLRGDAELSDYCLPCLHDMSVEAMDDMRSGK